MQTGVLDQSLTTPALELRSTGTKLVWSSGARTKDDDAAPDLFAAAPGAAGEVLYDNPNRDSRLEYLDGVGDQLAFMELNPRVYGEGGWALWYVSGAGAKPVRIDSGGGGQLPFFGISERYIVWTVLLGSPARSELRSVDLTSMEHRLIASDDPAHTQFWFPDVDGTRLVYGTVELAADRSTDERHIYLMDLDGNTTPVRLDDSTSASEPAIRGDTVVWKESDPDLNFLVAGTLVRHSIEAKTTAPLNLPAMGGFTDPSIGDGYVAAWPATDRMLYVADLQSGTYPAILDLGPTTDDPHESVGHADIAGKLLGYFYGPAHGDLELRWVQLP